eukprot:GHVU01012710.1.p1 GENE.GHVU01012710.1~~GHVU01012710.1.p1  ORF type:complete len:385 (+),score=53.33 GHVU01012710.1:236-1390(+)
MISSAAPLGKRESCLGDVPGARFGHTTTFVGQSSVILFGGAVGDQTRYVITNDAYLLDIATCRWSKIVSDEVPTARAAHAAACVDTMQFVVYGGATGGGSLSSDDLYLLDVRKQPMSWMRVPITGVTPGRRYGHSMVYHKPNLVVVGGNNGKDCFNDIWFMDVEKSPFRWHMVSLPRQARQPPPRVYHSSDLCTDGPAKGMIVVFGGRTAGNTPLNDAWGLRQHRDGSWDWVEAPSKSGRPPEARFMHTCMFVGTKMLVMGGRAEQVSTALATAVYDTEVCEWRTLPTMGRFRHSAWALDSTVYVFGGFTHMSQTQPTADLVSFKATTLPAFYSERDRQRQSGLTPSHPRSTSAAGPGATTAAAAAGAAGAASVGRPATADRLL